MAALELSRERMLERFAARDRSWDGRFLTGVLTTGIYCLPSCPARRPKPENVRFFATEDEARLSGLRPCKRCKPDRFYREGDPDLARAEELARRVRERPGDFPDVASLAREAGLGVTKLNALFLAHFHRTAAAFLARARVERAAHELVASDRRPLDVALEAGFESSSAFHAAFARHTGLTPGRYRRLREDGAFAIALPEDWRGDLALAYLGRDPASPCERLEGRRFAKAFELDGAPATLVIELGARRATCRLERAGGAGPEHRAAAHGIARRVLGLDTDAAGYERRVRRLGLARDLIGNRVGLRVPLTATVFEGLVWAVIGQQVNLAFAFRCRAALVERAGRPAPGGLVAHPDARALAALEPADLAALKLTRRKSATIVDVARRVAEDELDLERLDRVSARRAEERLLALAGVGPWTAQYVLMRALGLADCVPAGDSALATALAELHGLDERPDPERTRELLAPLAPHRSLATFHLWRRLTTLASDEGDDR